jgi:hypothetical protein
MHECKTYVTTVEQIPVYLIKYINTSCTGDKLQECVSVIKTDLMRSLTILKGMNFIKLYKRYNFGPYFVTY